MYKGGLMPKVTKAVIPAAGFGTRFLPQTKAMPKEMLPIVDKPTIQYIVEELVDAGITDIIFVTGYHKRSIEDHFDTPNRELIANLEAGGEKKRLLIDQVERVASMANFIYVRQKGRYGNATPLANIRHIIGDEPFVYKWADDLMVSEPGAVKQLIEAYEKYQAPILACQRADKEEYYKQWAFVGGEEVEPGVIKMNDFIEKPGRENAPSNLGALFGMVLTPDIFPYIDQAFDEITDESVEVNYADALKRMAHDGYGVYGMEIKNSRYYDTGNKLEYLKTIVDFALCHEELGDDFRTFLNTRLS